MREFIALALATFTPEQLGGVLSFFGIQMFNEDSSCRPLEDILEDIMQLPLD